ncbi:MAG: hypothetical protein S4CHLAM2_10940 [Chlamydiales bacterium]|nr:hypothetical protein [Chlamydiales bacterium]
MNSLCPTIVVRHRKENLKKCSLRGLEEKKGFHFYTYPLKKKLKLEGYVLLSATASEVLTEADSDHGLVLLDGTWKLATRMEQALVLPETQRQRRLPPECVTAYPRRQDETAGLASVEALYIAYLITGRCTADLLDNYYWKELFLEKNRKLLDRYRKIC